MKIKRRYEIILFIIASIIVIIWIFSLDTRPQALPSDLRSEIYEIQDCQYNTENFLKTEEYEKIPATVEDCKNKINGLMVKIGRRFIETKNESLKLEYDALMIEYRANFLVLELQKNIAEILKGNLSKEQIETKKQENAIIIAEIIELIDKLEEFKYTDFYMSTYKVGELQQIKESYVELLDNTIQSS